MKKALPIALSIASMLCGIATDCRAAQAMPLNGEWHFALGKTNETAPPSKFTDQIKLPGTMDDAGLGPKNTNAPTLQGPYRLYNYAGPAWYQREIDIPADWAGKRVTLFLERCRWVTTVWIDNQKIGSQDSLIAPHVYDFGTNLTPGKHRLTICVDNTVKINLGKFVSALFGGTWGNMNGIIGRLELAATPPVWIDEVQVYPDMEKKLAHLVVKIGNATGKAGHGQLSAGKQSMDASWNETGGRAELDVDMSSAKLWDEFSPSLTELTVKLGGDERTVRFGMRKFAVKGTQFTMNGRPIFLRGTLECSVWPLTGYPPTDVAAWRRIFQIEKSYGLNFVRFHSWCPPEAAFEAADLEGIMIQAEGPNGMFVGIDPKPDRDIFVEAELQRIVDTYGNHPSFCLMTLGNEFGGNVPLLTRWLDMLIQRDSRHLYTEAASEMFTANRQWTENGLGLRYAGSDTAHDSRAAVATYKSPLVGHEVGQWTYWPDFNAIKKWTGVMALKNFEMIQEEMKQKHLLDQQEKFVDACGHFSTLLYKEDIEVLLRTPGYGGFSLLDLHDYPTQGTALVGLLDPFWDSKGFITPEAFRQFCSPIVPLLRLPKRVYTTDEPFTATLDLANFSSTNLTGARPVWTIKDEQGRELASGELPPVDAPTGQLTALAGINASLVKAPTPCKAIISVGLQGTSITNSWDIWIYPASATPQPPAEVSVCQSWEAAKRALEAGKKVVFFPDCRYRNPKLSLQGRFRPVFWSPVWIPNEKPLTMGLLCDPAHPLFALFPTEAYSNWQWYDLMAGASEFILDDLAPDYHPLVQVIDNFSRNHRLGVIFEGSVGKGELLVCGFNLPQMTKDPAARQLLASLYAYVGSTKFHPSMPLDLGMLDQLFTAKCPNKLQLLGAKIHASSQQRHGFEAKYAIDSDPDTFWQTSGYVRVFPYELDVELPQPVTLAGITCLPCQDNKQGGRIKDFAVFISDDGHKWGTPVTTGKFENDLSLHTVKFESPITTRFFKLEIRSIFGSSKPSASLAELNIITTENQTMNKSNLKLHP